MRSLLLDIASAFNNVYSGWIWWNLFLAFVPLMLSYSLFRPGVVPQGLLRMAWALTAAIGVVGLWPRLPRVMQGWFNIVGHGGTVTMLRLLWLLVVIGAATALSLLLLKKQRVNQSWLWWAGVAVFLAFLPNAPYVLTDIIHLIRGISSGQIPIWVVALVFIPIHSVAIFMGFQAYVISIINLAIYLKHQGARAWILPVELTIHALCAVGIYLGRFCASTAGIWWLTPPGWWLTPSTCSPLAAQWR